MYKFLFDHVFSLGVYIPRSGISRFYGNYMFNLLRSFHNDILNDIIIQHV